MKARADVPRQRMIVNVNAYDHPVFQQAKQVTFIFFILLSSLFTRHGYGYLRNYIPGLSMYWQGYNNIARDWCFHENNIIASLTPKITHDILNLHQRWSFYCYYYYSVRSIEWSIPYNGTISGYSFPLSSRSCQLASLGKPWSQQQMKLQSPCTRLSCVISTPFYTQAWWCY